MIYNFCLFYFHFNHYFIFSLAFHLIYPYNFATFALNLLYFKMHFKSFPSQISPLFVFFSKSIFFAIFMLFLTLIAHLSVVAFSFFSVWCKFFCLKSISLIDFQVNSIFRLSNICQTVTKSKSFGIVSVYMFFLSIFPFCKPSYSFAFFFLSKIEKQVQHIRHIYTLRFLFIFCLVSFLSKKKAKC